MTGASNVLDLFPMKRLTRGGWQSPCPVCQPDADDGEDWNLFIAYEDYHLKLMCEKGCQQQEIQQSIGASSLYFGMQDGWDIARLCAICDEETIFFRDPQRRPWAVIIPHEDEGQQRLLLRSADFRDWLVGRYWELEGSGPKARVVTMAIRIVAGHVPSAVSGEREHRLLSEVTAFARSHQSWTGGVGELFQQLKAKVGNCPVHDPTWPMSVEIFRKAIDELAPALGVKGVSVEIGKRQGGTGRRLVTVRVSEGSESQPSQAEAQDQTRLN